MNEKEKKEYIEHEIIDRLYCIEETDFNKDTVTQDYIESIIKAGIEAKELIEQQQKEIEEKDKLILDMKERLNNISFEVEIMWRKIEKVENNE